MVRRRFPVGLISIFTFVVTLAIASDALAACPPLPGSPCSYFRSPTGTGTGSVVTWTGQLADDIAVIVDSVPNDGLFDTQVANAPQQSFNCQYAPDDNTPLKDALCQWAQPLNCVGFEVGNQCRNGERESLIQCTRAGAGCTGLIHVTCLDPTVCGPNTPVPVAKDPLIGTSTPSCNQAFPAGALPRGVMGKLVQACSRGIAWTPNDRVISQTVRNDDDTNAPGGFFETSQWQEAAPAECNPSDGLPGGSCTQEGVISIRFPVDDLQTCTAANLRCGQKANGELGDESPSGGCTLEAGVCTCQGCPRCGSDGQTLVNVGFPPVGGTGTKGAGFYTITNNTTKVTAACPVDLTGTQ